ncbi:MAG: DUF3488 domain-containing transglutaminase family protein [Gammaproteobacteria bacterium]|nr:DUF3488 domain-containing transglutaminase family protein [Gammaproteobacteria bacterium]
MSGPGTPTLIHFHWLLAGLLLAVAPHALRFHPAVTACFVAVAAWRLLGYRGTLPLPERHRALWLLKLALGLGAVLAVWVSYRGQPTRDAGIALLILLIGLKLIELRANRDYYVLCLLGYFLVATNLLYDESILVTLYLLGVVWLLTAGLLALHAAGKATRPRWCLRQAGALLAQALPPALLAFLLLPRLEGPLWGRPQRAPAAQSGLAEEMAPGMIAALSLSEALAFRVTFEGPPPPPQQRYWRGPVLWDTDGQTWRAGSAGDGPVLPLRVSGPAYRYTVTLEPHGKRWLFALELPSLTGTSARSRSDLLLVARFPVVRRISYDLISHTSYRVTELTPRDRAAALALPEAAHPRARELARRLRDTAANERELVALVLRRFGTEPFRYTLTPPLLSGDTVDQFLFDTRAGFCEHYAAAFVVLMRAAGIPARIVTGYLGGELNPLGEYFIVRQRDAHAWAEVWYEDDGWVRVDPTASVAPARIERGIADLLPAPTRLLRAPGADAAQALWRAVDRGWDAIAYRWDRWVVGYNQERQRQLFERVGLGTVDRRALVALTLVAIAGLLGALAWALLRWRGPSRDPVQRLYLRFCRKLRRLGLKRLPHEGPLDFAHRAARAQPRLHDAIMRITEHYLALRYGQASDRATLARLVRRF